MCFRESRGVLLSGREALDCWMWFGYGADHVRLHALHIRPLSGRSRGSCGTLCVTQNPRAPVNRSIFLQHLKIYMNVRQGSCMCPFVCVYIIRYQGVNEKEGRKTRYLKMLLRTAGTKLPGSGFARLTCVRSVYGRPCCSGKPTGFMPQQSRRVWASCGVRARDPRQTQVLSSGLSCGLYLQVEDGAGSLKRSLWSCARTDTPEMQTLPWLSTAPVRMHEQPSRKQHFKKLLN